MDYIVRALREHPELAIFLALAIGFLIGRVKIVGFESSGLSKFAILESAVKVSSLEEALIVIPSS